MKTRKEVLIVDDHPLIRAALDIAVQKSDCENHDIKHCSSMSSALSNVGERTRLILLDLNLPDAKDFEGFLKIQSVAPGVPIIVVSALETAATFQQAQSLGADGYLPKSYSLQEMSDAINCVIRGDVSFPDCENSVVNEAAIKLDSLTTAQKRVMSGLARGLLNKQIAYEMDISEATVKAHMTAIFRKLGANNRTQALLIYRQATAIS